MEKTAVEFLEEKLQGHLDISRRYWNELLAQAKEMFEQQIIDAHIHAQFNVVLAKKEIAEQYYNETFKTE
jgi:hypothetical protein